MNQKGKKKTNIWDYKYTSPMIRESRKATGGSLYSSAEDPPLLPHLLTLLNAYNGSFAPNQNKTSSISP